MTMKSSSKTNPNPVPAPVQESKPDLVLTPEEVQALEAEKQQILASLGYTPPAPAPAKKKVVVADDAVKESPVPVQELVPPPPIPVTPAGQVSDLDKALAQIDADAAEQKAKLLAEDQANKLAAKKAALAYANQPAQPGVLQDITSRIEAKIHSATVAIAEQEREKFMKGCISTLEPADKLAQITLDDLDKYDLAPWGALLGWDGARLQRMKVLTVGQASRLGAVQDILRNVPQFRKQLLDVRQDIRDFPKQYGNHARPIALMRVKELVAVVEGSTSAPFHLRNALRDATKLLAELNASTLKADPSTIVLEKGHAALAGMAEPKVFVQDKAETTFNVFAPGTGI